MQIFNIKKQITMSEEKKPFGAPISASQAMVKINRFKKKYPEQTQSCAFPAKDIIKWAEQINSDPEIEKGVFFLGLDKNEKIDLIYYPATSKGNLKSVKLNQENVSFKEEGGPTGDNFTSQCPPFCNCPPDDPNCNP